MEQNYAYTDTENYSSQTNNGNVQVNSQAPWGASTNRTEVYLVNNNPWNGFYGIVLVMVVSLTEGFTILIGVLIVLMIFIEVIPRILSGALVSTLPSETLDMVLIIMLLITGLIDTEIMLITDLIQGMV